MPTGRFDALFGGGSVDVWQPVRNTFVTINTSLFASGQQRRVHFHCAFTLAGEVHRLQVVSIAALEGIIRFQARPLVLG